MAHKKLPEPNNIMIRSSRMKKSMLPLAEEINTGIASPVTERMELQNHSRNGSRYSNKP